MIDHKKGQKIKKELSSAKKWLILLWEIGRNHGDSEEDRNNHSNACCWKQLDLSVWNIVFLF